MEPNNIEDLIKSALDQRKINPSPEAKERLILALNSKPKKKKVLWFRYGIAACVTFLLLFLAGNLILKDDNLNQPNRVTIQKKTIEVHKEKESMISNENIMVSEDLPLPVEIEKPQLKDTSTVLYTNQLQRDLLSQKNAKNEEELKTEITQEIPHYSEEVKNNYTLQTNAEVLTNTSQKDSTQRNKTSEFSYITPENLLAETQADTSLQWSSYEEKLPDMYVNSDDLLLEMERQLFDDKHKNFFKKVGKRLKKLNETIVYRNYEH